MNPSQVSDMTMRNLLFGVIFGLLAVVHSAPADTVTQIATKAEDEVMREAVTDGFLLLPSLTTASPKGNTTVQASQQPSSDSTVSDMIEGSAEETSDASMTSVSLQVSTKTATTTQSSTSTGDSSSDSTTTHSPQPSFTTTSVPNKAQSSVTPDHISTSQTTDPTVSSFHFLSTQISDSGSGDGEVLGQHSTTTSSMTSSSTTESSIASSTSTTEAIIASSTSTTESSIASSSSTTESSIASSSSTTEAGIASSTSTTEAGIASSTSMTEAGIASSTSTTEASIASSTSRAAFIGPVTSARSEGSSEGSGEESGSGTDLTTMLTINVIKTEVLADTEVGSVSEPRSIVEPVDNSEPDNKGHSTPGWIIIVGFLVGLAALVMIFVAIATRDKWNGPSQASQQVTNANTSNQQRGLEMETFLHKDSPKENGRAGEYTVIPLDELPEKYSSH